MTVNGERLSVYVLYRPGTFQVIPTSEIDIENNIGMINLDTVTVFLRGHWKLQENELVFYIEEDNLFDGIYEEIHFAREELKELPVEMPPAGKYRHG